MIKAPTKKTAEKSVLSSFAAAPLPILATLVLITGLSNCSKGPSGNTVPPQAFSPTPTDVKPSPNTSDTKELPRIGESVPESSQLVWMKKDFWLGRKIWVSLGVERSSVTGLAMSVVGYIPAQIRRAGGELILQKQNKGLFGGTTLGPEFAMNSYPIVGERDDAILVNLAAPKSPYGLSMAGVYAGENASTELLPRVEYTKDVSQRESGVSFTNVLVAKSPEALFDIDDKSSAESMAELDPYMLSATIRTDWMTDLPADKFEAMSLSDSMFGFFTTSPLVNTDGSDAEKFINKINTNREMIWTMSGNTPVEYQDSVKAGLLSWNNALGKDVLKVQLAKTAEGQVSYTDPSTSNIVWDDNQAIGMAFANWRSNPYTGEIVQAQVYMSGSMWASEGKLLYKIRGIEKRIRELIAARAAAAAPAPVAPAPAPTPAPEAPSETAPNVGTAPNAITAALQISKAQVAQLKKQLNTFTQQPKTAHARRLFLGLNLSMSRQQAESRNFCTRETSKLAEMKATLGSLEKLLRSLDKADSVTTHDETNPNTSVPVAAAPVVAPIAADTHSPYPPTGESADDFSKDVVRAVVMHEVGHTMGLRHNFIGSTGLSDAAKVQSASIMDYNDLVIDASFQKPGDSDLANIKKVYGSNDEKNNPTKIKFCTDEDARKDLPGCEPFDFGTNPIAGLKVQEETNLLIAKQLLSIGQSSPAIGLIRGAIRSVSPMINFVLYPTDDGIERLEDEHFLDKQKEAWQAFNDSKTMLNAGYPATLQQTYGQILIQLLCSKMGPDVATSEMYQTVLDELTKTLIDADGKMELETRMAAIMGLKKVQDFGARAQLVIAKQAIEKKAKDLLVASAATTTSPPNTESPAAAENNSDKVPQTMEDQEILTLINKALNSGFFVDPK